MKPVAWLVRDGGCAFRAVISEDLAMKIVKGLKHGLLVPLYEGVPDPQPARDKRRVRWEDSKARAWLKSRGGTMTELVGEQYLNAPWEAKCHRADQSEAFAYGWTKVEAVNALRRKVEGKP